MLRIVRRKLYLLTLSVDRGDSLAWQDEFVATGDDLCDFFTHEKWTDRPALMVALG